jgi:S-adenosylmethionine synthetase
VISSIDPQSPDIAQGVDPGGAGDQGLMFGYACDETTELMPMPLQLAHSLTRGLSVARRSDALPWLRPDGKSQVSVEYDGGKPVRIDAVVISCQHAEDIHIDDLRSEVHCKVALPILPESLIDDQTSFFINPTGRFVTGGPQGDCGLTGRKIIVDTYGGVGSHGGGAFSGKDPSKVDRSASYRARHVAKNIVKAGLARRCEVQLAYAIGVVDPVSVMVDSFGTGTLEDDRLTAAVREVFDLTPRGIIRELDLLRPIYKKTAAFGHFGRNEPEFTWERTDRVDDLRSACQA